MKKLAGLFLLCFNVNSLIDFRMFSTKSIYYLYFVFSFALLFPYATITGKVTDINTEEPLVGVNVILEGTSYGSSTDIDGEYLIENIPLDDYTLKLMYIGYKNKEISVSLNEEKKYNNYFFILKFFLFLTKFIIFFFIAYDFFVINAVFIFYLLFLRLIQ